MINANLSQFFRSFFYLLTGFIIFDFSYLFIYGWSDSGIWQLTFNINQLSWIMAGICIVLAIFLKHPNKSVWQMIFNKENKRASYLGISLFSVMFVSLMYSILSPYIFNIIYDYTHDQCLSQWWYCFEYFK